MRYATAAGFRTTLEHRLQSIAREHGQAALTRQRKLVVFDRLLARLLIVAPGRWIVKGGLALDLRLGDRARTTRDMDLARQDNEEAATADLFAAHALDLGDFFLFTIERTAELDTAIDDAAVRYHVTAEINGRRFERVVVDIGFGDSIVATPDVLAGPTFLAFAGIEPILVPALPLETHIAEKAHAYTWISDGGRESTRVKDPIDLALMHSAAAYEAGRLRAALHQTFTGRNTRALPPEPPSPPSGWSTPYRRNATEVDLEPSSDIGHRRAAAFLDPLLGGPAQDAARWNDAGSTWKMAIAENGSVHVRIRPEAEKSPVA